MEENKVQFDMKQYKPKATMITAAQLDQDVMLHYSEDRKLHLPAGNYLIQTSDGKVFPANKNLFEFLFEKSEENNEQN